MTLSMTPPKTLTLATHNPHKVAELQLAFAQAGLDLTLTALPSTTPAPDENAPDFIQNALIKAKAGLITNTSDWILAEDAGLVIPALAGFNGLDPFPGVRSNRWLTPELHQTLLNTPIDTNGSPTAATLNQALLALLAQKKHLTIDSRQAAFMSTMVLLNHRGEPVLTAVGECTLQIILPDESPRGNTGFGYDPIVYPVINGVVASNTMAELTPNEKNTISHRGKALAQVIAFLKAHP